jgi:hypothetical protein
MGRKKTPTINKDAAAIHSYVAIASPILNPDPLIPINCSAEIFEAISEAPIAHHVKDPSARKKSFGPDSAFSFGYKSSIRKDLPIQNRKRKLQDRTLLIETYGSMNVQRFKR